MKNFIVLLATIPLLLIFMVQFSMDQVYSTKTAIIDDCVYTAKEQAKQAGCFTRDITDDMRGSIASMLGIPESDIITGAETDREDSVKYRLSSDSSTWEDSVIHYKFYVKIDDVIAGRSLLRSGARDYYYVAEGKTTSERLKP